MLIQLVSDLHGESRWAAIEALKTWRNPKADLLVLAGDICSWSSAEQIEGVLEAVKDWPNVILLAGNHEHYGSSPQIVRETVAYITVPPHIRLILTPQIVTINNVRFFCGTMWFSRKVVDSLPYGNSDTGRFHNKKDGRFYRFSDFMSIKDLSPWVYEQHEAFIKMLADLTSDDVVVTHHLPSEKSTPPQFQGTLENVFFVSDQEAIIVERQPSLWVHGHTHTPCAYQIGQTSVMCNPLGYRTERQIQDYRPLEIEI